MTTTPVLVERSRPTPLLLVPPGPDRAASARVGTSLLGLAVLVDVLRPGPATVAVGLVAMAIVTVFAGLGLVRGGHAMLSAGLAVTFAWAVGLRASPWLVRLDLLAASGLMVLAVSLARGGSLLDLGPDQVARRVLRLMRNALCGPLWAARPLRPRGQPMRAALPVLRGLVLAAPIVAVLGVLLASADVVFARLFQLDLDLHDVAGHLAVVALAWLSGCALAADAASPPISPRDAIPRLLGPVEAATILGSMVALFALFAGAQIVTLAGGATHVLETAGLTRAEYARSGFFQLLAVAALTLATLTTLRTIVRAGSSRDADATECRQGPGDTA